MIFNKAETWSVCKNTRTLDSQRGKLDLPRKVLVDVRALKLLFNGAEVCILLQKMILMSEHVALVVSENLSGISVKRLRTMQAVRRQMKDLDIALKDLRRGRRIYHVPAMESHFEKLLATYTAESKG